MRRFHRLTQAALLALTAAVTPAALAQGKDLKVGLLLPFSQVFAVYGEAVREGFDLAIEEAGGQVAGRKVVVFKEDNKEDPKVTLQLARRYIKDDEVDFLVGPIASHVVAAIRDEVHRSKTFLLVANAGNNDVTGKDCSPYIVRTSFSNWQVNHALGLYAGEAVGKSAMTIASNYDAGREMAAAFKDGFAKSGGKVAHEDWLAMGAADFAPTITNLRSRLGDVEMTWSFIVGAGGPRFVNQVTQAGIRGPKLKMVAPIWLGDELFFPAMGDNAVGMLIGGHYMSAINTPVNNAFQARFQKRYGKVAHTMHVQGYDTAKLMLATVDAMKGDLRDKDKVRKTLTSLKIDSPRGPFAIDPRTGNVVQNIYIGEVVKQADGALAHKIVKTYEKVADPGTGCSL
jgi:branched-chain amino acid transport system substrate-binding protein